MYRQAHQFFKRDFDPTGINDDNPLVGGKLINLIIYSWLMNLTQPKNFILRYLTIMESFFDGRKYSFKKSLNLRVQPLTSCWYDN